MKKRQNLEFFVKFHGRDMALRKMDVKTYKVRKSAAACVALMHSSAHVWSVQRILEDRLAVVALPLFDW